MNRRSRFMAALSVGGALSVLTACGGGSPDLSLPAAQTLFADYSGSWVLDTIASDAPPAPPEQRGQGGAQGGDPFGGAGAAGGRGRAGGGMAPGGAGGRGGAGGGMAPGGRGGRGGPGQAGGDAMQATRHLMAAARQRPERITVALDEKTFTVDPSPAGRAAVPVSGDAIDLPNRPWPTKAKVQWDDLSPRLEVSFDQGGKITDRFEVVNRDRLIVTRSFEVARQGSVEIRYAYDREGS